MAGTEPPKTRVTADESRQDRLKSALKANMARRKAQMRARRQARAGDDGDAAENED